MRMSKVLLWVFGLVLLLVLVGTRWFSSDDSIGSPAEVHTGSMDAAQNEHESNVTASIQPKPSSNRSVNLSTNEAASVETAPLLSMLNRATVVDQAQEVVGNELVRKTLYVTDFKYPLVLEKEIVEQTDSGQEEVVRHEIMVGNHVMACFPPDLSRAEVEQWANRHGYSVLKKLQTTDIYLIQTQERDADAVDRILAVFWASFPSNVDSKVSAEPDFLLQTTEVPNDIYFGNLWGMHNTGQSAGTVDADIDAVEAWDIAKGSHDVLVGIIDTGIDRTHPDLAANMWINAGEVAGNGIDDDNNGFVDDVHGWDFYSNDNNPHDENGHGTHCAGTIGAVGNNGTGVVGVNWTVSMVALRFLGPTGVGTTSDAIEAVNYGTLIGVELTSNSWGGDGYSAGLMAAIANAGSSNVLFVAAAGNSSSDNDVDPHYPSNYNLDCIIAVAASDRNDALSSFSCYGLTSVDLAAPGSSIYSTIPGGSYGTASGTSMATPHVAGAAALVISIDSGASCEMIKGLLLSSVDPHPAFAGKCVSGGRMNLMRSIKSYDRLRVFPFENFVSFGFEGEPFSSTNKVYQVYNVGAPPIGWTVSKSADWLDLSTSGGVSVEGNTNFVEVSLNSTASTLAPGIHSDTVLFSNTVSGVTQSRAVELLVNTYATVPFNEDFESGGLGPYWRPSGTGEYRVQVTSANLPHAGSFHATLDDSVSGSLYSRNELTLGVDLAGQSNIVLRFWAKKFDDEAHGPPATPFVDGADFDGVAISADGVNWYEVQGLRSEIYEIYSEFIVDLDAAIATHGLAYNSTFKIRFNQYGNYSISADGIAIDDISITSEIIIPKTTILSIPLDSDPGWATEGQWAFGVPLGNEGDPSSGYTGTHVYGYNLAGAYANNIPQYWLTSSVLDCSGYSNVELKFRQWLGVESAIWDHAEIEVSNDGSTWSKVWSHTGGTILGGSWFPASYDISSVADNQSTVYLRWGMGPTDSFVTYCGWNIDDIELEGHAITTLIASFDNYITAVDTELNVAAPGVLANDYNPTGEPLTAILDTDVSNGTLTLNYDGSFVYTPNPGFAGTDSFTYYATDPDRVNESDVVTVTISVGKRVLVGGLTLNGDFNANPGDEVSFADTAEWYNLGGEQTVECTRNNLTYDGSQNAVLNATRHFGLDTGHTIAEGDVFDISYVWRDAWMWLDAFDQVSVSLFVTHNNTIAGLRTDLVSDLSGTSTIDGAYEAVDHNGIYTAVAGDAGKTLFLAIETASSGFARVDNCELVLIPGTPPSVGSGYDAWIMSYGMSGVLSDATNDYDGDGLNNLWEYGSAGDPTNPELRGIPPALGNTKQAGGANWIEYIHLERTSANHGLTYTIEQTPDLIDQPWSNSVDAEVVGYGDAPIIDFLTVTNRIPTDGKTQEFLRLRIEK